MLRDEFLIQRCLGGEKEAFGQLVDKYKDAVHGLVYSRVPNFHDAQDIAQEVFIDAYRNLRSLRYPHRFSSWIYTITANHCWTWLRKRSRESSALVSLKESQGILQEQAICQRNREGQVLDRLLDAIDKLPEASRLVMMLYYVNGLTCKEIGEFTGTSINTVMSKRIAQENLIIPGRREAVPHGGIGLMYVGRDGRDMWKAGDESRPGYMDVNADLQQIDGDLYSVPFPQKALRQGDTWVATPSDELVPESRYTVVGFKETKGYNCVILDREQTISITRKVKSRIACDIQSGMIVRLDAEVKIDKHAEKGNEKPQYSTQRVSAELIEWEQLDQEVLVFEKQVFDQIESAFAAHRFAEPDALNSKLKVIKKQYPTTRLALGLEEMIREADSIIATRAQDAKREYTYRNHTYTIARLLIIQYEITGEYTKRVPGASMPESKRTPFYEYEIVDIEGSGPDSNCKIVARGKKATPAEGEAWYRTVSASEGIGEIKPYVNE